MCVVPGLGVAAFRRWGCSPVGVGCRWDCSDSLVFVAGRLKRFTRTSSVLPFFSNCRSLIEY